MNAIETILVSRRDSVAAVEKQVAALDTAIASASVGIKPVLEGERKVKFQRLERLRKEVAALEAEVARTAEPTLPGMGAAKPPAKPTK